MALLMGQALAPTLDPRKGLGVAALEANTLDSSSNQALITCNLGHPCGLAEAQFHHLGKGHCPLRAVMGLHTRTDTHAALTTPLVTQLCAHQP